MAANVETVDLREELGAGTDVTDAFLQRCIDTADALLRQYAGADYAAIPVPVVEEAWLATAVEIYHQRQAPNGIVNQSFASPDGGGVAPVRIGADPLRPAYPLLERWVIGTSFA